MNSTGSIALSFNKHVPFLQIISQNVGLGDGDSDGGSDGTIDDDDGAIDDDDGAIDGDGNLVVSMTCVVGNISLMVLTDSTS